MGEFIVSLLEKSGRKLLQMQNAALAKNKGAHDLVTDADFASEKIIVDAIRKKYPTHAIYSEESHRENLLANDCWVIDPLDGTNNYAYGFPIWGVSIAYAKKGEVIAGGVAYPSQGIIMYAEKGRGAKMAENCMGAAGAKMRGKKNHVSEWEDAGANFEGRKIHVSKRADVAHAMTLVCAHLSGEHADENLARLGKISKSVFNVRSLGAAVYNIGYVAAGLADACVEFKLQPYDGAAGALLVREAGGKVTDLGGKEWRLDMPTMVATNGKVHSAILQELR